MNPQEEIIELKNCIKEVYFKDNDDDNKLKQNLLSEVNDLESIIQDEDFYLQLDKLYQKILSRQKENVKEFKESSEIVKAQVQQVYKFDQEVLQNVENLKSLQQKSNIKLQNIQTLQSSLDKDLQRKGIELQQRLRKLWEECEQVKQEYYDRLKQKQMIDDQRREKEQIIEERNQIYINKIQKNKEGQKKVSKQIDTISDEIKKIKSEQLKLNKNQQYISPQQIEESNKQYQSLLYQKQQIEREISTIQIQLNNYQISNSVIEYKPPESLKEAEEEFILNKELEQIKIEDQELEEQISVLEKKVEQIEVEKRTIDEKIEQQRLQISQSNNSILIFTILCILLGVFIFFRLNN